MSYSFTFVPAEPTSSEAVVVADGGSFGTSGRPMDGREAVSSSGGTSVMTLQRPAPYDDKGTWDAYHTQFEMLAQIYKWNSLDKAAYMAISLRGPAATVPTNLPPDQQQDYIALNSVLQVRFGTAHQTELNRMKLKALMHWREESLPELAEDIEHLVRLVYPDAAETIVEVLVKDQFVAPLPEDMWLQIRQNRPAMLGSSRLLAAVLQCYQRLLKNIYIKALILGIAPLAAVRGGSPAALHVQTWLSVCSPDYMIQAPVQPSHCRDK